MIHRGRQRMGALAAADPELGALMELLQAGPSEATELFSGSLNLLVERLGMDLAQMIRVSELGYEVFWWAARPGFIPDPFLFSPPPEFSDRILEWPRRTLVVRDTAADPLWGGKETLRATGIRSFVGAPLWEGGELIGTLGVQSHRPRDFTHGEVALVAAVGNLLSKTLEIEDLKAQLRLTREALELSSAVVQDSALHSARSGLPNLHYLEIWLKANLTLARRKKEGMSLLFIHPRIAAPSDPMLKRMADSLRGVDLMVDCADGHFLLLLPGTPQEGIAMLYQRLCELAGPFPAGATVWDPVEDDLALRSAQRRMRVALHAVEARGDAGLDFVPPGT